MLKLKPENSDSFEIVGFAEEMSLEGQPKGRLGSFACVTLEGETFSVGTGFTHKQRQKYWMVRESLIGKWIKIRYQDLTEDRQVPKMLSFDSFIDPP